MPYKCCVQVYKRTNVLYVQMYKCFVCARHLSLDRGMIPETGEVIGSDGSIEPHLFVLCFCVFVCLCFCVFVCLCVCMFVFAYVCLRICVCVFFKWVCGCDKEVEEVQLSLGAVAALLPIPALLRVFVFVYLCVCVCMFFEQFFK